MILKCQFKLDNCLPTKKKKIEFFFSSTEDVFTGKSVSISHKLLSTLNMSCNFANFSRVASVHVRHSVGQFKTKCAFEMMLLFFLALAGFTLLVSSYARLQI